MRWGPTPVLAHSDVAPGRKIDPGEKFNWLSLAKEGLGLWVRPSLVRSDDAGLGLGDRGPRIAQRAGAACVLRLRCRADRRS